jgi:hypothetical protein
VLTGFNKISTLSFFIIFAKKAKMPPKPSCFFYSYPALKRRAKNILLLWSMAKR